ncbi:PRC-barrel domain-containing protein [Lutimaribacter pacificus]|uniref:PRC-barrel domain-containing protein n=1 Tax=Lutimaribacter pacificus TaxID=391948 RepID=A0A1H0LUS1_9RHOB|nr:PRC-barrel domain-containing protein [Lutimaribacter pacificus]SDO71650.1 PRC-barrel domain-containing protein [Lutimaribacter pacificus]SHK03284.1 PRC-barrel domain-containing protein [Lutimaribacter pacificus]
MKAFLISTAILAAGIMSATAQQSGDMFHTRDGQNAGNEMMASDLIGMRVYRSDEAADTAGYDGAQSGWDDIGEINDIVLTRDGSVDAVLVDIGGFLGIGEHQVALDMGALGFTSDTSTEDQADFFIVMMADPDMLENAPAYDMDSDQASSGATSESDQEQGVAETDQTSGDTTAAQRRQDAGTTEDAGSMTDPAWRDGYRDAEESDLTAERLTGAKVYGSAEDWVGEVSDIVLASDGSVEAVVIDVGGFLGIGEKPVALRLSDIDILRSETGEDVRVHVPMTEEELDGMPEYTE